MRIGCSSLKSQLCHNLHVEGNPSCNCGHLEETPEHPSGVHVTLIWCTRHTHLVYTSHPSGVHVTPIWCTRHTHLVYTSHPYGVHVTPIWCTRHIHLVYTSHPSCVHVTPFWCTLHTHLVNTFSHDRSNRYDVDANPWLH